MHMKVSPNTHIALVPGAALMVSAFVYNALFLLPGIGMLCAVVFPLPLYALAYRNQWTFGTAWAWAFMTYAIHVGIVWYSIVTLSGDTLLITLLPYIIGIAYVASVCGGVVWLVNTILSASRLQNVWWKLPGSVYACMLTLYVYSLIMEYAILAPFNTIEGYFLAQPLLAYTRYPSFGWWISYLGIGGGLGVLYAASLILYYAWCRRKLMRGIWITTGILGLVWYTAPSPESIPEWVYTIASVGDTAPSALCDPEYRSKLMIGHVTTLQLTNPRAATFVTPEGYWYDTTLGINAALTKDWRPPILPREARVIVGGFEYDEHKNLYNTLFVVHNGEITHTHRKTHTMVITERVPALFPVKRFENIFCKHLGQLTPSSNPVDAIPLTHDQFAYPYICSEFFFSWKRPPNNPAYPLLVCGSDRWLMPPWSIPVERSMLYTGSLKALIWSRPIVYVTDRGFYWIDRYGYRHALTS